MTNLNSEVLIIGAGAAGLMAARTLAIAGKDVMVLEARDRCGGRIHTIDKEPIFKHAELGAEFIHGDLPVTLNLLDEAGIKYGPAGGEMWHFRNGKFSRDDGISKQWDLLIEKLSHLKHDTNIAAFLEATFPEEIYTDLRNAVIRFASGYDTADVAHASSFALRQEWQSEDDGAQHRIEGGYDLLIDYLQQGCEHNGCKICLNTIVKEINWSNNNITIITSKGVSYHAKQVIIALPLGVLQTQGMVSSITFKPPVPKQTDVIKKMGFGAIIKVLLEFRDVFWSGVEGIDLKNMGFILSEEAIPTWWTQAPISSNILTGWLGGPKAAEHRETSDDDLLDLALQSLANIFVIDAQQLKINLRASEIINWTADPFTLGSYAYDTVNASQYRKLLSKPINGTIYFAGEYLYEGPAMGTVEAALTSGLEVAQHIINNW